MDVTATIAFALVGSFIAGPKRRTDGTGIVSMGAKAIVLVSFTKKRNEPQSPWHPWVRSTLVPKGKLMAPVLFQWV